jgi:hypothetical protein
VLPPDSGNVLLQLLVRWNSCLDAHSFILLMLNCALDAVGSKNSAELKVPHFTRFTACQILPSQPVDFIRQPWRLADFRQ